LVFITQKKSNVKAVLLLLLLLLIIIIIIIIAVKEGIVKAGKLLLNTPIELFHSIQSTGMQD